MPPGVRLLPADAEPLEAIAHRGIEPANLYRALAHSEPLLDAWLAFAGSVRKACVSPRSTRELIILRSAQLTGAAYIWSDHVPMALQSGVSLEQIAALVNWHDAEGFSEPERRALAFAEELCEYSDVSDQTLAALGETFSEQEHVELALTAGFYAMVPRVLAALRVPLPDRPPGPVPFPGRS